MSFSWTFNKFLQNKSRKICWKGVGNHDDVIKWKKFSRYWAFVRGIHRSPMNYKGQWRGALMFPLICTRINGWVNNGEAYDLWRHRSHYDVTAMIQVSLPARPFSCSSQNGIGSSRSGVLSIWYLSNEVSTSCVGYFVEMWLLAWFIVGVLPLITVWPSLQQLHCSISQLYVKLWFCNVALLWQWWHRKCHDYVYVKWEY